MDTQPLATQLIDRYEDYKYTLRRMRERGEANTGTAEWIRKEVWLFENYGRLSR